MKAKSCILGLLAGAWLLAACASGPAATPLPPGGTLATDLSQPAATSTLLPPTPTVPQATDTPVPSPANTAFPAANRSPSPTPLPPIATTKISVNVRAGPDVSYPLIGKLKKGDKRAILGKTADSKWWQIDFDGRMGWIPADYTDWQGGTDIVAVVSLAPPTATPVSTPATPTPTATLQVPTPEGRVYFVIQQSEKWLAPTARNQIFPGVTLGVPGDFNANLSTNASPLDWSAPAGKLAFVFNNGSQDKLETIDQDSNVVTLASHGAIVTPRWFGDGAQIAFVGYDNNFSNQSVYIVGASDGRVVQNCPARSGEQLRGLAVNPKTGDIAFVSNFSGRFEIWKESRTCGAPTQLTFDDADATAPAFSPDGSHLAYVSNKNSPTDYRIILMRPGGGNATQLGLTASFAPAFSPDGFWIAFWHNLSIYIMDISGNNIQALTPGERPAWAP